MSDLDKSSTDDEAIAEGVIALSIDGAFVDKKFRRIVFPMCIVMWVGMTLGFAWEVNAGRIEGMTWAAVVFISVGLGLTMAFAIWLATKWAKQERVLVNDWNFGCIGGPGRVLCFGEGNPLVVRTNRSGKRWVLSTKERPRKKVKMFVDAYPLLAGFLKKFCANVEIPAEMARRSEVEADLFHTELKGEE